MELQQWRVFGCSLRSRLVYPASVLIMEEYKKGLQPFWYICWYLWLNGLFSPTHAVRLKVHRPATYETNIFTNSVYGGGTNAIIPRETGWWKKNFEKNWLGREHFFYTGIADSRLFLSYRSKYKQICRYIDWQTRCSRGCPDEFLSVNILAMTLAKKTIFDQHINHQHQ